MSSIEPIASSVPIIEPTVEMPYSERIDLALEAWKAEAEALSIRQASADYEVSYTTLNERTKEAISDNQTGRSTTLYSKEKAILVK
jgi:hypothetical protein